MNKASFYGSIRNKLFGGILRQSVIDNIEALLQECEKQGVSNEYQVAYILATVYHETKKTMEPVEEDAKGKGRPYGRRLWYSRKPYTDVPHIYFGRGHTQNSWRDNYRKLTFDAKKQGHDWDFENHPELLLQKRPSAWASVHAMKTGLYTGLTIGHFFNDNTYMPLMARSVVNGKRKGERLPDRAQIIANIYDKFLKAIQT